MCVGGLTRLFRLVSRIQKLEPDKRKCVCGGSVACKCDRFAFKSYLCLSLVVCPWVRHPLSGPRVSSPAELIGLCGAGRRDVRSAWPEHPLGQVVCPPRRVDSASLRQLLLHDAESTAVFWHLPCGTVSSRNILFSLEGQRDLVVWDRFGLGLLPSYHCSSYCAFQNTSLILSLAEWALDSVWFVADSSVHRQLGVSCDGPQTRSPFRDSVLNP